MRAAAARHAASRAAAAGSPPPPPSSAAVAPPLPSVASLEPLSVVDGGGIGGGGGGNMINLDSGGQAAGVSGGSGGGSSGPWWTSSNNEIYTGGISTQGNTLYDISSQLYVAGGNNGNSLIGDALQTTNVKPIMGMGGGGASSVIYNDDGTGWSHVNGKNGMLVKMKGMWYVVDMSMTMVCCRDDSGEGNAAQMNLFR